MEKVTVAIIRNPFDPVNSREIREFDAGLTVGRYMQEFIPVPVTGIDFTVAVNGKVVEGTDYRDIALDPGDSLSFCATPQGGGGSSKNPIATVAMLAVVIAAPMAAGALVGMTSLAGTAATVATSALTAGFMVGGGLLVNSLFPAKTPTFDNSFNRETFERSQTYGWETGANVSEPGIALPVLYGRHRVVPPLIARYVETQGDKLFLNLLYAVSGHEVDAVHSIQINDQPSSFYSDVKIETRIGTNQQDIIPFFTAQRNDISILTKFTTDWITRQVTQDVDAFGIGLIAPMGLYFANDNGGLSQVSLDIDVQYRRIGEGEWSEWLDEPISGSQNSPKRWFFTLENPASGFGRYEYRFRLKTPAPSGPRYGSDLFVDYHQEIIDEPLEYPNTALLAVRALATDQLSGAEPRVSCIAERMTANVDGTDRSMTNPAWASVHMLTDDLNGGDMPYSRIEMDRFAAWADNCDDNNLTCNIYFDDFASLKKSLDIIGTLGRGQVIQMGSRFGCLTDFPDTSVQRFSFGMGNIEAESFNEEWLPTDERADEIEVTYWDAENDYKRESLTIQQEGFDGATTITNKQSVTLYGCTNRAMAAKHAKFLLNKNRYLTLTASWGADVDALACLPGDVVDVAHDVPQWGFSGRIVEADVQSVKLDREVTLEPGVTYVVDVRHNDDTRETRIAMPVSAATTTDTLFLTQVWDKIPGKYDIYSFGTVNRQYKQFRILNISKDQDLRRRVQALEYVPEVYNDSVSIPAPPPSEIGLVKDFRAREAWVPSSDGSGRSVIDLSWRGGDGLRWNVYFRQPDSEWELIVTTFESQYRIDKSLNLGSVYGVAVSQSGPGGGAIAQVQIRGIDPVPSDVVSLQAWQFGGEVYLRWPHIPDINMWGYEIREGVSWERSRVIVDGIQENEARYVPTRKGTHLFWIKALSMSEKYSVNATNATLNVAFFKDLNIVFEKNEIPAGVPDADMFNFVLAEDGKLYWTPCLTDALIPSMTDLSAEVTGYTGDTEPGVYTSQVYDLLKIVAFTLRIELDFEAIAGEVTDLTYPGRTDLTFPLDTDVSVTSLSTADLHFRISDDNVTWGAWEEFTAPADLSGQYVQIRFATHLDAKNVMFRVDQCIGTVDVPDKVGELLNEPIPNTGKTYDLKTDFDLDILVKYVVSASTLGTVSRYPVIDKGLETFDVRLFDQSGNAVAGNADITVRGY